jgi:hypothetical protein
MAMKAGASKPQACRCGEVPVVTSRKSDYTGTGVEFCIGCEKCDGVNSVAPTEDAVIEHWNKWVMVK